MKEVYVDGSGDGRYAYVCGKDVYIGRKVGATNNEAEYLAVIAALKAYPNEDLLIYSDSRLVVRQLNFDFAIKESRLRELAREVWQLSKGRKVEFHWIPRENNKAGKVLG
jgi:ribonuclease HI